MKVREVLDWLLAEEQADKTGPFRLDLSVEDIEELQRDVQPLNPGTCVGNVAGVDIYVKEEK